MNRREYAVDRLVFRQIDFNAHAHLCLQFRADSFFTSFGTEEGFWGEDGKGGERYLQYLEGRDRTDFDAFHIWLDKDIIGQMEIGLLQGDSSYGYVNLFYLIPEQRGRGYAHSLHQFSKLFLSSLGVHRAKLSVSPTNKRAWSFYVKTGWRDLGPREYISSTGYKGPPVNWMELDFKDSLEN